MIDWTNLKAAIAEDKRIIRERKNQGIRDNNDIKLRATMHCAIAAHQRGHIHLAKYRACYAIPRPEGTEVGKMISMTLEEQAKFIAPLLPDFEKTCPSGGTVDTAASNPAA